MWQVTNGVKAERAKLVLLAPDTEASDTLDGKLDAMLDEVIPWIRQAVADGKI